MTATISFCGLGSRVRVKVLGSVNSNHNCSIRTFAVIVTLLDLAVYPYA